MTVWSDGKHSLYRGQRVAVNLRTDHQDVWFYGTVIGYEHGKLIVRDDDGRERLIDPYNVG